MKKIFFWFFAFAVYFTLASCSNVVEEPQQEGNPVMQIETQFTDVHFGDMLQFEATVSDDVPLSILTAVLYFGEEEVAQTTIRTNENGQYSGTIEVPFGKNIPDGTAVLEFTLVNTTLKKTSQTIDVPVTLASYPYLILVTADTSYPMLPTDQADEYVATAAFPSTDLPAYIKTPVMDDKGREIIFGWNDGEGTIEEGTSNNIPFASQVGGTYSVTFNLRTFEASPFYEVAFNGQRMSRVDNNNYQIDIDLTQGEEVTLEGLTDWWVDQDFFVLNGEMITFAPISGRYRVTASLNLNYLKVETLTGSELATLQEDGTGAIWIIGDNIGKPSYSSNHVGWDTSKAICMPSLEDKKYQVTLVGGETVNSESINFKFYHQKDWGGEFGSETLSTTSDIVFVGDGTNGRDNGNLGLVDGITLEIGATYVFTVDVSEGIDNAVLTVEKK